MDYYLIFGMVAACLIAMVGFMNSIKKSVQEDKQPIQDLNLTITELNINFKHMLESDAIRDQRISQHGKEIENLEKVVDKHELRLNQIDERLK